MKVKESEIKQRYGGKKEIVPLVTFFSFSAGLHRELFRAVRTGILLSMQLRSLVGAAITPHLSPFFLRKCSSFEM